MASYSPGSGRQSDVPAGASFAPAPGVVLFGRYRLEERLGEGGMAEVWRARDEQLDRQVAIKILHRHLLPDQRSRERFAAEARAAAGLSHPSIVSVHDILVDDQQAAMVLELVEGEPLSDVIARRGRIPEMAAAAITAQIAHALQAAHDRGIVHRDVKPANVLLSDDGRARLVDFGIARALDDRESSLTMPGTIMGTLRYMAPEQLLDGAADRATDVFGVGSLLYEMLVARPPFPAVTPAALMAQQRQGAPQVHGVSPELAGLARTALQVDPERRPKSAGRMASMLERWLDNRGVSSLDLPTVVVAALAGNPLPTSAPVVAPRPPIAPATAVAAPDPMPAVEQPTPKRRAKRKGAAAAAATASDGMFADGPEDVSLVGLAGSAGAAKSGSSGAVDPVGSVGPVPFAGLPDPSVVAAAVAAANPAPAVNESRPPESVATMAIAAPRSHRRVPFVFGGRRVPIVTAVGLAGLLLAGLLLAGALTALQAGTQRPGASPASTRPAATLPAAVSAAPTLQATARPTAAPAVNANPAKPGKDKPDKDRRRNNP